MKGSWALFGCASLISALALFALPESSSAASLTLVRDTIANSAPNASSTHIVEFTVTNAIPPSGSIVLRPQTSVLTILPGFSYTDVDMAVSSGGPYVERSLASAASVTEDGVAAVSGTSGSITITLNASTGISAGQRVRITLGSGATHDGVGAQDMRNTPTPGMYRMAITTRTASQVTIDTATAMFAIVRTVTTAVYSENVAPELSNGLPSGELAPGNAIIELSLNTNEPASCRYATSTGVAYGSMTASFTAISGVLHYVTVGGHSNGQSYTYYVKCADSLLLSNDEDYLIQFSIDEPPISDSSVLIEGVVGRGGEGNIPMGSERLYLANVTITGFAPANSTVFVLKYGKQQASVVANGDGRFSVQVLGLERGAYTFVTYALDSKGRRTSSVPSTMTLEQGTNNTISNVILPPTAELEKTQVALSEEIVVFGESVPGSTVEVYVSKTGTIRDAKKYTATTTRAVQGVPDGSYRIVIPGRQFPQGTYDIRTKGIVGAQMSNLSGPVSVGVGEVPQPRTGLRSDLNGDGKVNLTDFSILLTLWQKPSPDLADINEDGIVNLADFSIMLFDWTG